MTSLAAFLDWMARHGWVIALLLAMAVALRHRPSHAQLADHRSYRRLLREDRSRRAVAPEAARPHAPVGADARPSSAPTGHHRHQLETPWSPPAR